MTTRRFRCAFLLAAGLAASACGRKNEAPPPAGKEALPVEQTPVSSLYEEKPGVLYERPATTPAASHAATRIAK